MAPTIGKDIFAKVKLAQHILIGKEMVMMIMNELILLLTYKVKIVRALDHPNIVKLFEVMETGTVYPIMEYASGEELFNYLVDHGSRKREAPGKFYQRVSAAQDYCQKGIVHRPKGRKPTIGN